MNQKGVELQLLHKENICQTIHLALRDTFMLSYPEIKHELHLLQCSCPSLFDMVLAHFETKETTNEDTSSILNETPWPIHASVPTADDKHIQSFISRQLSYSAVSARGLPPRPDRSAAGSSHL